MTRAKKPQRGLVFYPNSHRYRLDGHWVQGVTTILNQGLPKDYLKYWAAKGVAEYVVGNRDQVERLWEMGQLPAVAALKEVPFQSRDEAADKGSAIHGYAERIAKGEEVDVPENLVPYVESCLAFLEDYDIEPTLIEACVGSREHRYAGKLDLIANEAIWDYKSGSGIYPELAFQLSGYAFAEFHGEGGDEKPLPTIKAAYGVHLRADGYDVYPVEFGRHIFDEFLAIQKVAQIAKRAKGDRNTPGYVKPALQLEESA